MSEKPKQRKRCGNCGHFEQLGGCHGRCDAYEDEWHLPCRETACELWTPGEGGGNKEKPWLKPCA